jgi:membrane fusion protein (multidrug efflux system)
MQRKNKIVPIIIAVIIVGLLTVSGCNKKQPPAVIPEVSTVTITPQEVLLTTELPGRVSAFRIAEIRPQVNGIIQKRLFTEGSDVKAGDTLYQIDPAPYKAAYDNAKAALGKAEANLPSIRARAERYKELVAIKAVSQQEYDDAISAFKQAEADVDYWVAQVEIAKINLGYTKITAPITGRIGKSNITDGALVTAHQSMALATIQQLDPIYVDVTQSTTELMQLKRRLEEGRLKHDGKNQNKVKLLLEDGTLYPLEGDLQFRDITVDPTTGSVILRAVFPNPQKILLPGMFVREIVKEGINKQAILAPQQAVSRDTKGNPFTLVVDKDNKVELRPLIVDRTIGDKWLVASGLSPGDQVIMEGIQRVRPGSPVKAVPYKEGEEKTKVPEAQAKPSDSQKEK